MQNSYADVMTPLRAENLCKLQWEQIDMDKGILTIKRAEVRAYSHEADYQQQMGKLFQWWSDYLDEVKGK
jgi:integrase